MGSSLADASDSVEPRLEAGFNIVGVCAARVVGGVLSVDRLARLSVGGLLSGMGAVGLVHPKTAENGRGEIHDDTRHFAVLRVAPASEILRPLI